MARFNFNISSLFSGLNSNSPFGSFNLSDYKSIKNGTYGKLMKSYYADQKKTNTDKPAVTVTNKKDKTVDKTGLSQMKKEADELKKSAEAFNKDEMWKTTDGKYDMSKLAGAVKDFVKNYNDVVDQSAKVNSKEIAQSMKYMKSMTGTMSKALAKVGIEVGFDGKLTMNEDTFNKADGKSVKALFDGAASYGAQIEGKAGDIARATLLTTSMYSGNATASSGLAGMFDDWI